MIKELQFSEYVQQNVLDISYSLIKLPIDYLAAKTHCMLLLIQIFKQNPNDQLLRQILNHVEYYISTFLPSLEKFNVEKRAYALLDYKFNADSPVDVFDQIFTVIDKPIETPQDQLLPQIPTELVGARSINLKSFGDICLTHSLRILKELQLKFQAELDEFLVG